LARQAKPTATPPQQPQQKSLPTGPLAAPHSTHYPILLLGFGNQPNWNLRIGLKGPERLDRDGYPPIPLEPGEVTQEAAPESWTYHAKDSATGAPAAVHLSREACTDAANDTLSATPPLGGKYSFKVSIDHAQLGSLKGCARIATELFPKINNQPDQNDDDTKKKPPVPVSSVTKFQSPVVVSYFNASQQLAFKRGSIVRDIPGGTDSDLRVSHDGKKLLFTREAGAARTINEYNYDSNSVRNCFAARFATRSGLLKIPARPISITKAGSGSSGHSRQTIQQRQRRLARMLSKAFRAGVILTLSLRSRPIRPT